jgi:hypothetical protein
MLVKKQLDLVFHQRILLVSVSRNGSNNSIMLQP